MNTIQNLFQQAQLAEAAYANLTGAIGNQSELKKALDSATGTGEFSTAQATDFVTHWQVVDQQPDTASGFSATLFQNTDTGAYSLAIRGSTDATDFLTDFNLIATDGIAVSQVVDLYNYWQRINAPSGSTYTAAKLVPATGAQPVIFIGGTAYEVQMVDSIQLSDAGQRLGTGKLNVCPASIEVDGHSLGGHLAMAFSRLFPSIGVNATAVNGLGFNVANANVNNLFAALGGAPGFDAGKIQNAYGIEGYEFAAMNNGVLQQPGGWDGVYIESASPLSPIFGGHGASQMTDSLAVYSLFATLDSSLNNSATGIDTITAILKASSNVAANSLESTVSALGKLFNVTGTTFTANEFDSGAIGRDLLYSALNNINTAIGANTYTLRDLSTLTAEQLSAAAQDGIGIRYALVNGNSFAVLGNDAVYDQHNTGGELDLYDATARTGGLTEQYLADRSGYLAAVLRDNTVDSASSTLKDVRYNDLDTTTVLNPINTELRKVTFGGAADEGFSGGDGNDGLYGGAGNDDIAGGAGNDHIEGNLGDDTLTGGAGNDTMLGGQGNDTYHAGDGLDTILDSDGLGQIHFGADLLNGGESKDGGRTWISADGKHTYALISGDINAAEGAILKIDGSLTVQHYRAGDLGLNLANGAAIPTTRTITGDITHQIFGYDGNGNPVYHYDDLGNRITTGEAGIVDDTLNGSADGDLIQGGQGGDILKGWDGDDRIFADFEAATADAIANGNLQTGLGVRGDWLAGGNGDDTLVGSTSNDVLSGGAGRDLLIGGAGDDELLGDADYMPYDDTWTVNGENPRMFQPLHPASMDMPAGGAADIMYGGNGNDHAWGGAGDDVIYGEGGNDVLTGNDGNDMIFGGRETTSSTATRSCSSVRVSSKATTISTAGTATT